ncbi:hypothetical protein ACFWUZ_26895 [Streptomyces sp. NPDC058646]|uniref:hypothetical protein n=1 Tax=Streptomyces sp. NPDC058646 TaxID=3346574 RepID=UPI00364F3C44
MVDFGTYAEMLLVHGPLKGVEDKLSSIRDQLEGLATSYKESNAAAIREEAEHRSRRMRERMDRARLRLEQATAPAVQGQQHGEESQT